MVTYQQPQLKVKYHTSFTGGRNTYLGVRQIKDNESPDTVNTDFSGASGIGNRQGFTQIGVNTSYANGIYGLDEFHTTSLTQLVKFSSNGSVITALYSTGGSWSAATGNTFTDGFNVDTVQAAIMSAIPTPASPQSTNGVLLTFNGKDAMQKFDGSAVSAHTGGTIGLYGEYFNERLWCVDDVYFDTLNVSTQTPDATKPLDFTANGTTTNPLTLTFKPGSGVVITGLKKFKTSLYVFLRDSIYKIDPTSTVNQYSISLVTNSVGCVSHRSICQVGEDLFFAADDGVYSLGEVAQYTSVRTTNKSGRIQRLFDSLSGASKTKLVGRYFNFKYHLFYSRFGTTNDSVAPYDIRYQAWLDWHNIATNDATLYTKSDGSQGLYFGDPTTGKVYQLYSGTTDDGTKISWYWYSKSFDEGTPDVVKLYFNTTYIFSSLNGSISATVIFNDTEISMSKSISQNRPQGGYGRDAYGRKAYGDATNTTTVTNVQNIPLRMSAKGQKFAIQYYISSSDQAVLSTISQLFNVIPNKFPSQYKIS